MQKTSPEIVELRKCIEENMKRKMRTPNDFVFLSGAVFDRVRETISPTTLKRLWGYLPNEEVQTRRHTLDVLARLTGFHDYEDFCARVDGLDDVQSGILSEAGITTERMKRGQRLVIIWRPDRRIVVQHLGDSRFEVVEAENTKLCVGDTFRCHLMIQHEPLYLDDVVHLGQPAMTYVSGLRDGVFVTICY